MSTVATGMMGLSRFACQSPLAAHEALTSRTAPRDPDYRLRIAGATVHAEA
ncbi:MAG: hypothetical protein ACREHD_02185 [Pirellulales bacterium]